MKLYFIPLWLKICFLCSSCQQSHRSPKTCSSMQQKHGFQNSFLVWCFTKFSDVDLQSETGKCFLKCIFPILVLKRKKAFFRRHLQIISLVIGLLMYDKFWNGGMLEVKKQSFLCSEEKNVVSRINIAERFTVEFLPTGGWYTLLEHCFQKPQVRCWLLPASFSLV